MIPESRPLQRPPEARLLVIDAAGRVRQVPRADFVTMLRRGDLAIANDAATLPASLHGNHVTTGAAIELWLAGWPSAILDDPRRRFQRDRFRSGRLPPAHRGSVAAASTAA